MDPFSRYEYDVTELTWEHGQLSPQGLGGFDGPPPQIQANSTSTWINGADYTLESIVHQAVFQPSSHHATNNRPPPPFASSQGFSTVNTTMVPIRAADGAGTNHQKAYINATAAKSSRDKNTNYEDDHRCTTRTWDSLIKSSSSFKTKTTFEDSNLHGGSGKLSESRRGMGEEAVCPSNSTRRSSRSASVHNQSERRRRDRINQKLKTLQKLVPNASKTDKASMLDEVIDYLKQLKAQVQIMKAIRNTPHQMMVAPLALQHQLLQMSLLAPMAMSAVTPNMNSVAPTSSASRSLHPVLLPATTSSAIPLRYQYDLFLAQAMNMDLYSRMAMFHHQQMSQKAEVKMNQSQMDSIPKTIERL